MEFLICLVLSAVLLCGLYFLANAFETYKEMQESAEVARMQIAARNETERNAPRILVKLSTGNTVGGWAPCQFVTIPDGEYIAWPTTYQFKFEDGEEESVCFTEVEQSWKGEFMRRDVYVRVADYPYLQNFPLESSQLQVLSANTAAHKALNSIN